VSTLHAEEEENKNASKDHKNYIYRLQYDYEVLVSPPRNPRIQGSTVWMPLL